MWDSCSDDVCPLPADQAADFGCACHFIDEGTKKSLDLSSFAGTLAYMVSAQRSSTTILNYRGSKVAHNLTWAEGP